jgi:hypothetical protein
MAFTDILEYGRSTYGSQSSFPQECAANRNLDSLFQHLTFAAIAAADRGYHTGLNRLYEEHPISAWAFVNHREITA